MINVQDCYVTKVRLIEDMKLSGKSLALRLHSHKKRVRKQKMETIFQRILLYSYYLNPGIFRDKTIFIYITLTQNLKGVDNGRRIYVHPQM